MLCPSCGNDTYTPGCRACEHRQPSLFPFPPPARPPPDVIERRQRKERDRYETVKRAHGRLVALRTLDRPIRVALVGCSKQKRSTPTAAREFYLGRIFRSSLAYAERIADETFILSAQHGLVALDDILAPYDRAITDLTRDQRERWAETVATRLERAYPRLALHVLALAGQPYLKPLVIPFARHGWFIDTPLTGLALGRRFAWLQHELQPRRTVLPITKEEPPCSPAT